MMLLCLVLGAQALQLTNRKQRDDPACPPDCTTCHSSSDAGIVKCDECGEGFELTPGREGCLAVQEGCPAGWTQNETTGECVSPYASKLDELLSNQSKVAEPFVMANQTDVCTEYDQRQLDTLGCESYMCTGCCSNWCIGKCAAWMAQYPVCSCTTPPTLDCSTYNETLADAAEARMDATLDKQNNATTVG